MRTPVEAFTWLLDAEPALGDPVCQMRVDGPTGRLRWNGREYLFCSLERADRFAHDRPLFTTSAD